MEVSPNIAGSKAQDEPTAVASAASFVCGAESEEIRLSAINYLQRNPVFSSSRIPTLWSQIYTEKSAHVIGELERLLGVLEARGVDSSPLLIFHLHDRRPAVAERALDALCRLRPFMGDAFIAALSIRLPEKRLEQKRAAYVAGTVGEREPDLSAYLEAISWVRESSKAMRSAWIRTMPAETIIADRTEWRRFVALFSDPRREKVWSCIKKLWNHEHLLTDHQKRALVACQASFCRDIVDEGNPVSTRFFTRALSLRRAFAGSLAHVLHKIDLSEFPEADLQMKVAALQLLPAAPVEESLDKVISQLWHVTNLGVRAVAIEGLAKLIGELEERAATKVIRQVFEFLREVEYASGDSARDVAAILTRANSRDVPCIVDEAERFLGDETALHTRELVMRTLGELQYSSFSCPDFRQARAIIGWFLDHQASSLCRAAQDAMETLQARVEHSRG